MKEIEMAKDKITTDVCRKCGARCCRYMAMEIDEPENREDYDNIRWYLLHRGVSVFIDHDDKWHVEFEAECEALGDDQLCSMYESRPVLCRGHGDESGTCEFFDDPCQQRFETADQLTAYLDREGVKWRWKKAGTQ